VDSNQQLIGFLQSGRSYLEDVESRRTHDAVGADRIRVQPSARGEDVGYHDRPGPRGAGRRDTRPSDLPGRANDCHTHDAQMVRLRILPSLRNGSSCGGAWGRWVRRLRYAHLVPEALGLTLRYRLRRQKGPLSPVGVELDRRSSQGGPALSTALTAVRVATAMWPFRTTCLIRAMVLARMLRRRSYPAEVVIGVSEEGVDRDPRFAHAWVEVEGAAGPPGFSELVRLVP